ncbi:hypothetical protein B6A10_15165 [Flavobacterium sp. L1I52]|uniref:DUF2157 domain-containing protein n=1 Tax=Flavobacterium pokkalii TaxID=1940408 RepID=A0ABR7UWN3_9FLAO|nr:hypothetical protein [Flavobacterium pokkalii]MBD0726513.1 hypothetical protein [Flavobacterium pokkalii]
MIAYDKNLLDNSILLDEAKDLKNAGFISKEQFENIHSQLSHLKTNKNLLVRLGFFLLGCLMYSSICGTLSLTLFQLFQNHLSIILLIIALVGIIGLEFLSRENYFGQGLDDAFLFGFLTSLGAFVGSSTNGEELLVALVLTLAAIITYLRYLHLSSALIACIAATATIAYTSFEIGEITKSLLPFIMMLFANIGYWLSKGTLEKTKNNYYYKGLKLANNYCLILFYLAGNYLVVRELSIILLGTETPKGQDITFAPFFYIFTFFVPVAYILNGLRTRNRIMLWIGVLALTFSIYSIRYYYALLPLEIALTIGGIIVFFFSYFTIERIKEKELGITFKIDRFLNSNTLANAEILITATQMSIKPTAVDGSKMKFGGGDFSGGGSSGNF